MNRLTEAALAGRLHPDDLDDVLNAILKNPATDWEHSARCANTDGALFYPETTGPTAAAKRICATCPVIADCRSHAIIHAEQFGVWGGLSPEERRPLVAAHQRTRRRQVAS